MKLRVLADNNTCTSRYYLDELVASYYIECNDVRLLFDAEYSDVFSKGAEALRIDLGPAARMIFSRSHNDHTRGLGFMSKRLDMSGMEVVAHPSRLDEKVFGEESTDAPYSATDMAAICRYRPYDRPWDTLGHLVFLGEIPDKAASERRNTIDRIRIKGKWQDDYVKDDSTLAYRGEEGIFIITGCSRGGIYNIVRYVQIAYGRKRIFGTIGRSHLLEADERLVRIIDHLRYSRVKQLYPCCCVSLRAKAGTMEALPMKEVGVGMEPCLDGQTAL